MKTTKKWAAWLAALALLACALPTAALAAETTILLDGYAIQSEGGASGVVEVKEGGQLSLKGDLTKTGEVELRDFVDSAEVYTCPVYTAAGPVELTLVDGLIPDEPTSGTDEDGDIWVKLSLADAQIASVTYDAESKSAVVVKENALYFDGKISYETEETSKTVSIKEFYTTEGIWDEVTAPPSIHKGAKATLTEPGAYRVSAYYEALAGGCIAYVIIPEAEETKTGETKPTETKPETSAEPAFIDVAAASPFAGAIDWAVEQKITAGYNDGTFRPGATCTRAQILTFLWRAAGSPESASQESPYSDVVSGSINGDFYKAILWAAEKGIAEKGETFEPNAPCTRASTVVFLWKYAGSPEVETEKAFTDVDAEADYAAAVAWAVENGVTAGTGDGTTFSPDATCTRGQIVTFLNRDLAEKDAAGE